SKYPEVVESIIKQLRVSRDAGDPLTVITARAVIVAKIIDQAPEIFERSYRDGSQFSVSDAYVRWWLRETLNWTLRQPTRSSPKI
ncbi:hypothetical protein B0H14DRAFT_2168254, partial [Mycena olivaceomarginata]